MALITRVSRLFRADLHAVIDRLEEPDVLLRQAIREMEEALARDERRLKGITQEERGLAAKLEEAAQVSQHSDAELDLCFESGKEDLAKTLIRRRLEADRLGRLLGRKRDTLQDMRATLETQLVERRSQLEAMRQKAELFRDDEPPRQPEVDGPVPGFTVSNEDVEVAFLREREKRSRK